MARTMRILSFFLLTTCVVLTAGPSLGADDQEAGLPSPKELSPEMTALRDYIRQTALYYYHQPVNTQANTATDVMHNCLAFGSYTKIRQGASDTSDTTTSGITYLCSNQPCAGYRILSTSGGRIVARNGYALQVHPGQLLALLAQSDVSIDAPLQLGHQTGTVADLVESEKRSCREGTDLSLKLIGLSHYLDENETWQDNRGSRWSVRRLITEELARPFEADSCRGTNRLMGLTYAVRRRASRKQAIDGEYQKAQAYVTKHQDLALTLQNSDGSWSRRFFAGRGAGGDAMAQLCATGRILEWLVFSLPKDRLAGPRIVKSVRRTADMLGGGYQQWDVSTLCQRDIGGMMHAVRALTIYDARVFRPAEAKVDLTAKKTKTTAGS